MKIEIVALRNDAAEIASAAGAPQNSTVRKRSACGRFKHGDGDVHRH
jgi:hypothetical protein